ncbi:MAG: LysR family transcriptional regulator [Rhodocyclaceae bacterium]|nr:LysR family transcriptional regulator [Rhodocyclaceae bacterium]
MPRISIEPTLSFRDHAGHDIDPVLFKLLAAVRDHGRLTAASREVGYSYRHCWNMIRDWSAFFGAPLVDLTRGRGARLAPLGEALAWSVARVQARLGPQLHNLAQEIDREINRAVLDTEPTVRVAASHGYAVALLPELVAAEGGLRLELNYLNSLDAVAAMVRGQADVAGFHVPIGPLATLLFARYARWLKPRSHVLARLVTRAQGLMLAPGNPLGIHGVADLVRPGVRFINRQEGSGTRALLDGMLEMLNLDPASLSGYADIEFTHAAVAAHVASGQVDAGFGVEAAAARFGLDFIPLATERYVLAMTRETAQQKPAQRLLAILAGQRFADSVSELAGYRVVSPGSEISAEDLEAGALDVAD